MAKSRQPVVTAGNIALPWPSHQNAANDADISSDQHWSDRLCSDCAICWSSAHWHWPGCSAAASITLVTALTAAVITAAAITVVHTTAAARSWPMAMAGTTAGDTATATGTAERSYSPA